MPWTDEPICECGQRNWKPQLWDGRLIGYQCDGCGLRLETMADAERLLRERHQPNGGCTCWKCSPPVPAETAKFIEQSQKRDG